MFDHVEFSVANIDASRRFYRAVCEAIGYREVFFDAAEGAAGFGAGETVHLLITGGRKTAPHLHLCLVAANQAAVEAGHAAALAAGGVDNGAPGFREHYASGYFAAFAFDPDGHNVEFLHRQGSDREATGL